jgi:luciferase family oxidoreductase group 1
MNCNHLDLGILEFGYIGRDDRLRSRLEHSVSLAQTAEECGYSRFWFTEHHGSNLQIASPEVVIAAVAANTKRIRVGSAGILLGYYSPLKVAEVFHILSALFPDRIDLGLARGVGAPPELADLLRDGQAKPADAKAAEAQFERKTLELIAHLRSGYETEQKLESASLLPSMPEIWLMGSGTGSAALAARIGAKLSMALWYQREQPVDVEIVLANYVAQFQRASDGPAAMGSIALSGICAETDTEAEAILAAARERFGPNLIANFCGSPERCRETILELAARHGVRQVSSRDNIVATISRNACSASSPRRC